MCISQSHPHPPCGLHGWLPTQGVCDPNFPSVPLPFHVDCDPPLSPTTGQFPLSQVVCKFRQHLRLVQHLSSETAESAWSADLRGGAQRDNVTLHCLESQGVPAPGSSPGSDLHPGPNQEMCAWRICPLRLTKVLKCRETAMTSLALSSSQFCA